MGRLAALRLALCLLPVACSSGEQAVARPIIGSVPFAELGWRTDTVLTAAAPTAEVVVVLPAGATQAVAYWYGLELAYEWTGEPGQLDDRAYLRASWNGQAVYQLKIKQSGTIGVGFEWSMADAVNGSVSGLELTDFFSARSTNFAPLQAVAGGENKILFELDLQDASNQDISVRLKRTSAIRTTSLQPPMLEVDADSEVVGEELLIRTRIKNSGWAPPSLNLSTVVFDQNGNITRRQSLDVQEDRPHAGEIWEGFLKLSLPDSSDESAVHLVVDWSTGSSILPVWPPNDSPGSSVWRFAPRPPLLTMVGALTVLWLTVPELSVRLRSVLCGLLGHGRDEA